MKLVSSGLLIYLALMGVKARVLHAADQVLPQEKPVVLGQEEHASVIKTLKAQWESARTEISSAVIKFRSANATFINAYMPSERMLPMIEQYEIFSRPENAYNLACELNSKSPPLRKEPFSTCELYMEGQRIKVDYSHHLLHALDERHHYFYNKLNSEVDLTRRGQSSLGYDHPFTIRPVPKPQGLDLVTSVYRYPQSGLLQLNYSGMEGFEGAFELVYESSGLPYMIRYWSADSGLERDEFFVNHAVFPGGVEFPTTTFEFRYRKGLIFHYSACLIDEAEFNSPVKPSDLAFSAPAGVFIMDYRNKGVPYSVKFPEPVSDVAYYVDHILDSQGPIEPVVAPAIQSQAAMNPVHYLMMINGVILILLGLYLWRSRVRTTHSVSK